MSIKDYISDIESRLTEAQLPMWRGQPERERIESAVDMQRLVEDSGMDIDKAAELVASRQ